MARIMTAPSLRLQKHRSTGSTAATRFFRLKPGGGAILDLGCANRRVSEHTARTSWKLFGIEMSEEAAREVRSRCGAEVFVGDILDAPFPPNSFDVITCFNVFEHVYEPKEVLVRVAKWLKPGGVFYTLMPNIDSAGARIFRSYWYPLELPRHLSHFSPLLFEESRSLPDYAKSPWKPGANYSSNPALASYSMTW